MRIDVVTLFPELFEGPLGVGLVGKALAEGRADLGFIDPRAFTSDRHRTVDDAPYGGGAGMVMKVEPLAQAIEQARGADGRVLLMSPQGAPLSQASLQRWAQAPHLVLVAGRYEGFDERVRDLVDEEVSLGDYVLTGGEYAALVVIDGVVRLLPGTLGNQESHETDSFSDGLLEHPQYTRPASFRGAPVPDVLTSGDHGRIARWRREQALLRTRARRPDLLARVPLSAADRSALWSTPPARPRPMLAVEAPPDPERLAALAGLARTFGLERAWVVAAPGEEASLRAALGAAPVHAWPVPLPPPKRRANTPAPIPVEPAATLAVASSWDALFEAEPAAWVGHPRLPLAPTVRVVEVEALAEPPPTAPGWGIALGAALESPKGALHPGLFGAFPRVRGGSRLWALDPVAEAAVLLDRALGEA